MDPYRFAQPVVKNQQESSTDNMAFSGTEIDEIRGLAAHSEQLLASLQQRANESLDRQRTYLEQFGADATGTIEQIATQIASEIAEEICVQQNEQIAQEREVVQQERAEFEQQKQAWEQVRDEVETELANRERELIKQSTAQEVSVVTSELVEHYQTLEAAHEELQSKFDMALEDLQRHRDMVAQLEEQLATRPEVSEEVSQELHQLRAERDHLSQQVTDLENCAVPQASSADMDELRVRFEMAVDEVRSLKTEKAELEQKLAQAPTASSPAAADGGWEAQKARMLAMLSEEDGDFDEVRVQERASIEGTIQITDQIVAEKDELIESLKDQLEQSAFDSQSSSDEDSSIEVVHAILDEDEVIQQERARLADLEKTWEEKLRTAELELSVERAKIARAQSEIEKQQQELDQYRMSQGGKGDDGAGRRNWLNKLGLSEDIKD